MLKAHLLFWLFLFWSNSLTIFRCKSTADFCTSFISFKWNVWESWHCFITLVWITDVNCVNLSCFIFEVVENTFFVLFESVFHCSNWSACSYYIWFIAVFHFCKLNRNKATCWKTVAGSCIVDWVYFGVSI